MDVGGYVRLLRRRWRIVVLGILVCLSMAILATLSSPKVYTARTQLFVAAEDRADAGTSSAYTGGLFTQQRVKSYVSVIQSTRTAELVVKELGLTASSGEIAAKVHAAAPIDTVLINVSASDTDPERARQIADAVGAVFPGLVDEIERPASGGQSPVHVSVVQKAGLPGTPTSPRASLNLAFGLLMGLIVGGGAAALREALDTTVKDREQARELIGAATLGVINFDPEANKQPLVVAVSPNSPRAEAFRQLRTNLQFVDIEHPLRSVVFTSSIPGEGKSTTTCNLALSLSQAGLSVILVEGDLRRPRIAEYMGLEGAVGLTSVLLGRATLDDALQRWGDSGPLVLGSGPLPPNPSELLGSQGMQDLLEELEARADIVLIDAPPLLPVTDAAVLGTLTSGLVMLVRSHRTRREQLTTAVATVHAVGAVLLGGVLNMVPKKSSGNYSYGYNYEAVGGAAVSRAIGLTVEPAPPTGQWSAREEARARAAEGARPQTHAARAGGWAENTAPAPSSAPTSAGAASQPSGLRADRAPGPIEGRPGSAADYFGRLQDPSLASTSSETRPSETSEEAGAIRSEAAPDLHRADPY